MRMINAADLVFKSNNELIALIREISESLQYMDVNSREYEPTVASLGIVKRTLQARRMKGSMF
jgi:hypothetical protein